MAETDVSIAIGIRLAIDELKKQTAEVPGNPRQDGRPI
jgi:hypothetical protein